MNRMGWGCCSSRETHTHRPCPLGALDRQRWGEGGGGGAGVSGVGGGERASPALLSALWLVGLLLFGLWAARGERAWLDRDPWGAGGGRECLASASPSAKWGGGRTTAWKAAGRILGKQQVKCPFFPFPFLLSSPFSPFPFPFSPSPSLSLYLLRAPTPATIQESILSHKAPTSAFKQGQKAVSK